MKCLSRTNQKLCAKKEIECRIFTEDIEFYRVVSHEFFFFGGGGQPPGPLFMGPTALHSGELLNLRLPLSKNTCPWFTEHTQQLMLQEITETKLTGLITL